MSQFWHSHWAEDAYKPGLLGNWQVPNWHPKWPCVRHCVTTTFLADRSGRLLPDKPRPKRSPWGDFKGTWELPLKIDRKLAHKLSAPPRYKIAAWEAHKARYEGPCGFAAASAKTKPERQAKRRKSPVKSVERRTKKASPRVAKSKRRTAERKTETTGKVKGKTVKKETTPKTKGTIAKMKKTTGEVDTTSKRNERKPNVISNDRNETSKNEKTETKIIAEEPENDEEKFSTQEPEYDEEKIPTQEPKYDEEKISTQRAEFEEDNSTVLEESHTEKMENRKQHRKVERTECHCVKSESLTSAKIPRKATRNICTIHQRLRV